MVMGQKRVGGEDWDWTEWVWYDGKVDSMGKDERQMGLDVVGRMK